MRAHYVWAGTVLLIAATLIRALVSGDWSVVLMVVASVVLILASFAPDVDATRR